MAQCFFFSQTYFYHEKVHIKWDVVISSTCEFINESVNVIQMSKYNRKLYHHDGEQ